METQAEYASGHLLFVREHALMAQPFDPGAARFEGEAVAAVAAATPYQARDALRAIEVEYNEFHNAVFQPG
mgnify:CR=1 FL=1